MFRGKNYKESLKLFDKQTVYDPMDALQIVCNASKAKFDETVELHVKLGVDGRHADQQVRGAIVLPNGTGKTVRVLCFCMPELVDEALAAGADYAGGQELVALYVFELISDVAFACKFMLVGNGKSVYFVLDSRKES